MDVDAARQTLVRGCFSGALDLHTRPLAAVATAGERPRAFAVARWQAARGEAITSLRHEPVRVDDASARAVVAACDGTRDRRVLAQAAALTAADADAALTHVLERIALAGLLEA
jgi:hypothetical protein